MASYSTSDHFTNENSNNGTAASKSYFQKTVCLKDWWLVKAGNDVEGMRLGVAGFTSRGKQAVRMFSSAPILRRYDVFTLETVDGIFVVIEGFMNKARAEESGFPSEVCDHFVFGFPPYWEIYGGNCSDGESPHKLEVGNIGFSETSPSNNEKVCSEEGTQEDRTKKNLGAKSSLKGGKKETKGNSKSGELKSAFDSIVSPVSPRVSGREAASEDSVVQGMKTLESSGYYLHDTMKQPLAPSGLEKNSVRPSRKDDENVPQNKRYGGTSCILKSFKDYYSNSPLSACRLNETRECNSKPLVLEDPRKLKSSTNLSTVMAFGREIHLSEEISSQSEGRGMPSMSKSKGIRKDDLRSGSVLRDESIMSVSDSLGCLNRPDELGIGRTSRENESGGKSVLNHPRTGFQELADEMTMRYPYSTCVKDNVELNSRISSPSTYTEQDKNHERVGKKARRQNKMDEGLPSSSELDRAKNRKEKSASTGKEHIHQSENSSLKKARRKLAYESPAFQKEEELSGVSPESSSLNRSRSGRLLLPRLEFWRNQRAIYDADRRITGINNLHPNQPSGGS